MYRSDLDTRHKSGAVAAVAAIHAALALALLHMSGTVDLTDPQDALSVFDVTEVPPPPPEPPPPPPKESQVQKPKDKEGGSAPKNIRSEATPVVAPKPKIEVPTESKVAASETPRQGTDPTQGASNVRGPGTGAGGIGTGTGSGGSGNGPGGGGSGISVRQQRVAGRITNRDYPRGVRPVAPVERVMVWFTVDIDGRAKNCTVKGSSGNRVLDAVTCRLIEQRFRYRPARNAAGQPVRVETGYVQEWFSRGYVPGPLPGQNEAWQPG